MSCGSVDVELDSTWEEEYALGLGGRAKGLGGAGGGVGSQAPGTKGEEGGRRSWSKHAEVIGEPTGLRWQM